MLIFCSALHLATFAGYLEMTETILLQRDRLLRERLDVFDVDEADNYSLTPLMKAAINGHLEVIPIFPYSLQIVKLLLRFGASPRIKNGRGESALALACMQE